MPNPLVSVITPCYNGEKVVHRMLDSILAQTYAPIEYIFVNDGSTDSTEEVFLSYLPRFANRNIIVKYIKQENLGLGGAINSGLKVFTGEYLCWTDADDALEPDSIGQRVSFLETNPDFASITSDATVIYEDEQHPSSLISCGFPKSSDEYQFQHLLAGESIFCSGCHMIRSSAFLSVNPERSIYPNRRGQNWQMLLPLYFRYRRYFMNRPLYRYYVSCNSMSHSDDTIGKQFDRCDEHVDIICHTLDAIQMPNDERTKYMAQTLERYARKKLYIALKYSDRQRIEQQIAILAKMGRLTIKDRVKYLYSFVHS